MPKKTSNNPHPKIDVTIDRRPATLTEPVPDGRVHGVQLCSVTEWYRNGGFRSPEAAHGAFTLAYQQGLDGMGPSIHAWMGLTAEEYGRWLTTHELPPRKGRR